VTHLCRKTWQSCSRQIANTLSRLLLHFHGCVCLSKHFINNKWAYRRVITGNVQSEAFNQGNTLLKPPALLWPHSHKWVCLGLDGHANDIISLDSVAEFFRSSYLGESRPDHYGRKFFLSCNVIAESISLDSDPWTFVSHSSGFWIHTCAFGEHVWAFHRCVWSVLEDAAFQSYCEFTLTLSVRVCLALHPSASPWSPCSFQF
jgi:hypothetical protein